MLPTSLAISNNPDTTLVETGTKKKKKKKHRNNNQQQKECKHHDESNNMTIKNKLWTVEHKDLNHINPKKQK